MSQHHKLVYGSLFVFFAVTHVGCVGSGLKNMFTGSEIDGQPAIAELETEESTVLAAAVSGEEVENPSRATRLASRSQFSKPEPTEDETFTAIESKKRALSSIADRRINQFDILLAADPDSDGETSGIGRDVDTEPFQSPERKAPATEKSGDSLATFDQLMGTPRRVASRAETELTEIEFRNTAARSSKKKNSALDINVAAAAALFGAPAARQNTRQTQAETAHRLDLSNRDADQSDRNPSDVARAFARHLSGATPNRKARTHNAAFGAPPASAGDVAGGTAAFADEHRIVTASYGTAQPNVVGHAAGTDPSTAGHAQFTMATVAPVSPQESGSEVADNTTRRGLVQSFSIRNWLLLIGGVIVIALLFAPDRTKPLTMNSRPANG